MRNVMPTNRKIARALGDRSGFTLVEVLVASMILVVALLTLASMFPMGYRQITDAGRMTVAVSGARHILEDVGDIPFNNISNINGVDTASNTVVATVALEGASRAETLALSPAGATPLTQVARPLVAAKSPAPIVE